MQPFPGGRKVPGEAIASVPFDRPIVEVDELDRRRQNLNPVSVRVTEINIKGMALPMSAGPAFEIPRETGAACGIERTEQAIGIRDDIAEMVHRRSRARQKDEVVGIVLAVEEQT